MEERYCKVMTLWWDNVITRVAEIIVFSGGTPQCFKKCYLNSCTHIDICVRVYIHTCPLIFVQTYSE